jgi:hypothetical protein
VVQSLERKIDEVIAGEDPRGLRGIPLEVVDAIIEGGTRETTSV